MPFGRFDPTRCSCEGGTASPFCVLLCPLHSSNSDDGATDLLAFVLLLLWLLL